MQTAMLRFARQLSTPQNLLISGIGFLLMAAGVMPAAKRDILLHSQGTPPLDLHFWYAPETAFRCVQAYGEQGRQLYLFIELTADMVYPMAYVIFFCLLLAWLMKKQPNALPEKMALTPLVIFAFDLLENACIVGLLAGFPSQPEWLATLAGAATTLKWVAVAATVLMIVWLLLLSFLRRLKPKADTSETAF